MRHIGGDGVGAVRGREIGERARAALAGGDLRLQIGDVERRVARGPVAGGEVGVDFRVAEMAVVDEEEIVEQDAFVVDALAVGRSEEHTSELQSLMRISYAVFCLKKKIMILVIIFILNFL